MRLSASSSEALIRPARVGGGFALTIDDIEQSHVDLDDPLLIRHEYLRRVANVIDVLTPASTSDGSPSTSCSPAAALRVLHLGAGALTLPRYIQASRPGSEQTVVEIEPQLVSFVIQQLPLPPGTHLTSIVGDAFAAVEEFPAASFDAVVMDIFTDVGPVADLGSIGFYRAALALLSPTGALVVNVGDSPGLRLFNRQADFLEEAAADASLPGVWTLCDASMLNGKAHGNLVLASGPGLSVKAGADMEAIAQRWKAAGPHPAAVLAPEETSELVQRFWA